MATLGDWPGASRMPMNFSAIGGRGGGPVGMGTGTGTDPDDAASPGFGGGATGRGGCAGGGFGLKRKRFRSGASSGSCSVCSNSSFTSTTGGSVFFSGRAPGRLDGVGPAPAGDSPRDFTYVTTPTA